MGRAVPTKQGHITQAKQNCGACGRVWTVRRALAGTIRCPSCGNKQRVSK